ncbi:MAG: 3-dehydroquinate synthase [Pseudomonadota bacterium]
MNEQRLRVELDERGYDIVVGSGLLAQAYVHIAPVLAAPRVIVVSDDTVAPHYAHGLVNSLRVNAVRADLVSVPAGEKSKSFTTLAWLMDALLALKPDRKTTLVALGGGVVGDLTGFAASILMRGVPFIQIPTTLLAQVDSSVGGKTAINATSGKNLIGSFYQPRLVLADVATLTTLPARQMRAGYAEIIKYGLIMDAPFYQWCLAHAAGLLGGDSALQQQAVLASCGMKAAIVKADEREADRRALLNFGHTFAHALEAETGYGEALIHGEAVAIGMVMACRLSARMGLMDATLEQELATHLRALGLPAHPRDIAHPWVAEAIASHFEEDKKAEGGALTFVVLDALGQARVAKAVDPALAQSVVASFINA